MTTIKQIQPLMIMGAMAGAMDNLFDKIPKSGIPKRNYYTPPNYKFEHKGNLRNKPCPCGSIKKFKQCCWNVLGDNNGRK